MARRLLLVTGGAGFIGSAMTRYLLDETDVAVVNVDALTYAADLRNLSKVEHDPRYRFERVDIRSASDMRRMFEQHRPTAVLHFAAESHVDRSIDNPLEFVETNVLGTATLLQAACRHWRALPPAEQTQFRFLHVSTDEVYGSIEATSACTEASPYRPNSPYAASKAAADHLVRAWHKTYDLPAIISNCTNNFGPYQFPEKLIPLMIINALEGRPMPVYGRVLRLARSQPQLRVVDDQIGGPTAAADIAQAILRVTSACEDAQFCLGDLSFQRGAGSLLV